MVKVCFLLLMSAMLFAQSPPVRVINGVAVPSDFPDIEVRQIAETAPGKIFMGSTFINDGAGNYLIILENDGTPYYYRKFNSNQDNRGSGEFQRQANGLLTAYLFDEQFYIAFDSTFAIVDTFRCKNGYTTDAHEMVLRPNGHTLLIAKRHEPVDMSAVVDGGNPRARVLGNHIQELDENKNLIFEWQSWDHFDIADAVHENLRGATIDYVHMNSIAVDYDGHLIISSRHLNEITKIHRQTGELIWRLGGENNQFEFINEPYEFSYQHFARPVPGKPNSYTLFDNGNHRNPRFSRAVQYKLDTETMTAEKTWEFRYTPDRYSNMMGNAQRLPNGNTFINWSNWPPGFACEVDSSGNVLFEMTMNGVSSNRVRRFEWDGVASAPYLITESRSDGVVLIFNKFGDTSVENYVIYGGASPDALAPMDTTSNTWAYFTNLESNSMYYFKIRAVDASGALGAASNQEAIFFRQTVPGENLVVNGDFSDNEANWTFQARDEAQAVGSAAGEQFSVQIDNGGTEYWQVQLVQYQLPLVNGRRYRFEFDAWAAANRVIEPKLAMDGAPWTNYSKTNPIAIGRRKNRYAFEFRMTDATDDAARVIFNCGTSDVDCYFDNVSVKELDVTAVTEPQQTLPERSLLAANYPNPFNPETTIGYECPADGNIILSVFNLSGRRIKILVHAEKPAGVYRATWDGANQQGLPVTAGIYFYQLEFTDANGRQQRVTGKMSLIR